MFNRNRILIFSGIAFILIGLIFFLGRRVPTRYNWLETYKETSKQPFGTHLIYSLLEEHASSFEHNTIQEKLSDELPVDTTNETNLNYIFIGEGLFLDSLDVNRLLSFVENGHTAFISSKSIPYDLMFHLYYDECDEGYWDDYTFIKDTTASFNLIHEQLKREEDIPFTFVYRGSKMDYQWNYISSYYFCEQDFGLTPLGIFNIGDSEFYNFARVRYGEGFFYLHTTPITFSNIAMLEKGSLEYSKRIFSHLSEGPVYWDGYSRISEAASRRINRSSNRSLSSRSPMQYVLSQPPLAMAWYTLLITSLLYLLFMAKRRQRVIPVLEENKNTSMEFLKTIGRLYFLQNNHKQLCGQKMRLFKSFVKNRYHITIKDMDDKAAIERLANKSEIKMEALSSIFSMYRNIEGSSFVSENTLIDFHRKTEYFYKNCK